MFLQRIRDLSPFHRREGEDYWDFRQRAANFQLAVALVILALQVFQIVMLMSASQSP